MALFRNFSSRKFSAARFVAGFLILTAFSSELQAQFLEEIIVVAQKREQNQQDVPVAVTSLSGSRLTELNVTDVFDLQQSVPGLVVGQAQNSTTSNFAIRGVGTSSQNFGLESSVGLYVDGVYRARQSSLINEMVDMERTEVLRGPQGSLFGRNTPSGAVQLFTVPPSHEPVAYFEVNGGNLDYRSFNGAINGSLIEDVLAVRFTGFATYRDGYVDDVALGSQKLNDRDRIGGRFQVLYTPDADWSLKVTADTSQVDEICCAAVTLYNNYLSSAGTPGSDSALRTPESEFVVPGLINGFGGFVIDQSWAEDNVVAYNQLPVSKNKDEGITVEYIRDFESGTLTAISGYRNFDSDDDIDADFSDVDILRRADSANQDSFSQEIRFTNNGLDLNYIIGAYYFQQDLKSVSHTTLGVDANDFIGVFAFSEAERFAAEADAAAAMGDIEKAAELQDQAALFQGVGTTVVLNNGFPAGQDAINVMDQEHSAWALFGHLDYALTDQVLLGIGLRYTDEQKDLEGIFTEVGASFGALLGIEELTVLNPRPDIKTDFDDDNLTGSFKLSWFVNDTTMLYGSYSTGYKSGGTNTDRINPAFSTVFDAETAEMFEVGLKSDIQRLNLRINLAIHDTTTEDFQSNGFQGTGFNLQNAGEIQAQGFELETWWYPTDNLSISAAYIYNDAEVKDFSRASCWVATPFLLGIDDPGRAAPDAAFCSRSGDQISGNAENTILLSAIQQFELGDSIRGNVQFDYNYRDDMMMDNNSDPLKLQDGFGLLNLSVSLFLDEWNLSITAWMRNVTDERYYGPIFDVPFQIGKLNAYPGEERTYGLRLRYDL